MILIISDVEDLQVYWVTHYLRKWGAPYTFLSLAEYPQKIVHRGSYSNECTCETWTNSDGATFTNNEVNAVWYRKPSLPRLVSGLKEFEREYALNECRQALYGMYDSLEHAFWISNIHSLRRASNKPLQLRAAAAIGLNIPETLITNDPASVTAFLNAYGPRVIYKTLSDGILYTREGPWEEPIIHSDVFTSEVGSLDASHLQSVGNCPCLFQQYVEKAYELRIIVVGDAVFSVEIHSQEHADAEVDWRRARLRDIPHKRHELAEVVKRQCISLVQELGLRYGAIDMVMTKSGKYVFLEVNPNGQYGWLEAVLGPCISERIAKDLFNQGALCEQEQITANRK